MADGVRRAEKELYWRLHVEKHAAGELSVSDYCRRHGLSMPSFYSWRKELRKRDGEKTSSRTAACGKESRLIDGRSSSRSSSEILPHMVSTGSKVRGGSGFVAVDVIGEVIRPVSAPHLLEIEGPCGVTIRLREDAEASVLQRVITACIQSHAESSELYLIRSGEVRSC